MYSQLAIQEIQKQNGTNIYNWEMLNNPFNGRLSIWYNQYTAIMYQFLFDKLDI